MNIDKSLRVDKKDWLRHRGFIDYFQVYVLVNTVGTKSELIY